MEQKLKLVQIYVLRTDGVATEVGTHQDTEAVLADDAVVECLRLQALALLFALVAGDVLGALHVVLFGLLLLECDSFQICVLSFEEVEDGSGGFCLPHLKEHLQEQKDGFDLQEQLKLVQVLQNQSQVPQAHAQLLRLVRHHCTVVDEDSVESCPCLLLLLRSVSLLLLRLRRAGRRGWSGLELGVALECELLQVLEELVRRVPLVLVVVRQQQVLLYQTESPGVAASCLFEFLALFARLLQYLPAQFEILFGVGSVRPLRGVIHHRGGLLTRHLVYFLLRS